MASEGAYTPRDRANAEAAWERSRELRRTRAARLVNARAWCAHYNALSLAAHDQAARYAEKRDQARDLVEALEGEGA